MTSSEALKYLTTQRYRYQASVMTADLNGALLELASSDLIGLRKAARRLCLYTCRELGWGCYAIREWFLNRENMHALISVTAHMSNDVILADLLRAQKFFYERYILNSMWDAFPELGESVLYASTIQQLVNRLADHPSTDIQAEIAYLLVMIGNGRGWDLYAALLKKRPSSTAAWFQAACVRYATQSMTLPQATVLVNTLNIVVAKTTNQSVLRSAAEAVQLCRRVITYQNYQTPSDVFAKETSVNQ